MSRHSLKNTFLVPTGLSLTLLFSICPTTVHAAKALSTLGKLNSIEIISQRETTQEPRSSSEPRIVFVEMKKKVKLSGLPDNQANWLTDTRFAYDAGSPENIETFAVVQWIRGCMFHAEAKNGKVSKTLSIYRNHFGENVPFQHRTWEIDSDSNDPIYTAYEDFGRFALLRWNKDPKSLDAETSSYYGQKKPPHGAVFATDLPGSGFLIEGSGKGSGSSQNASLEFRTCLFPTALLPQKTDRAGTGIDPSQAIFCQSWDHKFIWDFKKARMTSPTGFDPVCEVK
jgi:hypothetical protein